jgi:pimeloyl-ACP methyl ester carboxylesterase
MPNRKRRIIKLSRFVGQWSLGRLLRWGLFLGLSFWTILNWHRDLPLPDLQAKYRFPQSVDVVVDGQPVHCRIAGKGPAVILLHDEGSSLHTWSVWNDSLSQQYQVISVDLPGFGLTGPNPRGSYSTFMYANFLDQLADSLQLKKFTLAGVGLGAQIAWVYAIEHQQRLDKLILMSAPGYEAPNESALNYLARTPVVNSLMWRITPRAFFRLMLEEVWADDRQITDSLVQRHFDLALRPGNREAFTHRAAVRDNRPPSDFVKDINVPTLILWGAEDAQLSPQHAYDFHKAIRGALIKIYQNTGHWPQEENGPESAGDVRAFLDGRF